MFYRSDKLIRLLKGPPGSGKTYYARNCKVLDELPQYLEPGCYLIMDYNIKKSDFGELLKLSKDFSVTLNIECHEFGMRDFFDNSKISYEVLRFSGTVEACKKVLDELGFESISREASDYSNGDIRKAIRICKFGFFEEKNVLPASESFFVMSHVHNSLIFSCEDLDPYKVLKSLMESSPTKTFEYDPYIFCRKDFMRYVVQNIIDGKYFCSGD